MFETDPDDAVIVPLADWAERIPDRADFSLKSTLISCPLDCNFEQDQLQNQDVMAYSYISIHGCIIGAMPFITQ